MTDIRDQKMPLIPLEPDTRKVVQTGVFYEAEEIAFQPHVVRSSFADVGLSPWRPDKILEALEKHCPSSGQVDQDKAYYAVCESVKACGEKKVEECCQLIRGLKPVKATSVQKTGRRKRSRRCCRSRRRR